MKEVKVSELSGADLNMAVAMAIGAYRGLHKFASNDPVGEMAWIFPGGVPYTASTGRFEPSSDWGVGGPLIEKYHVWLGAPIGSRMDWTASIGDSAETISGDAPLIAACRAIVTSKFGDVVSIPDELEG